MLKDLSQESEKLKEMNKTNVKNVFITEMKFDINCNDNTMNFQTYCLQPVLITKKHWQL